MPHDFKQFPELTNRQMPFYYFDSPHRQITESFVAKVVKVIDGDTIRAMWSERDFDFPIRFSNTAAPEIKERGGVESQKWLVNQILGEEVYIIVDPLNRVEKWGRLLGEIILMGMNINQQSIDNGHAVAWAERDMGWF